MQLSAETCRIDLDHIDPSSKFSQAELEEFYHATEVLTSRYKQHSIESLSKHGARQKKSYKFWSDADRHSLLLAINVLKARDAGKIAELLGDRNEKAVSTIRVRCKAPEIIEILIWEVEQSLFLQFSSWGK